MKKTLAEWSKNDTAAHWRNTVAGNEKTLREIAAELKSGGMRCNCDLDNWEPNQSTGHSDVCRIHKEAMQSKGQAKQQ